MNVIEKGICVRILEKDFRVACPPTQEAALRDAALYLDRQMREIRRSGRVIGMERIAVMAALNIAHEFLNLKHAAPERNPDFSERLKVLQEKIDNVLMQESLKKDSPESSADGSDEWMFIEEQQKQIEEIV